MPQLHGISARPYKSIQACKEALIHSSKGPSLPQQAKIRPSRVQKMPDPHTLLLWSLPLAFLLDAILGDPRKLPHPVRWMGWMIRQAEPFFRRSTGNELLAGRYFAISLIFGCWLISFGILRLAWGMHPVIGCLLESILLFYCLSARSLGHAAQEIYTLLQEGRLEAARAAVAMIVGRDVAQYQEDDIARATVETVAENLVDGVISPLFFAFIGGAPLALAYKMTNTLDSMVGYKNERYLYFGRAAARIDDIANWIPARLSPLFITLAALLLPSAAARQAWQTAWAEGQQHSSPNSGYPEAAFAGALGLRLGGPNIYHGTLVEKPYIGKQFGPTRPRDIRLAVALMYVSALLSLLAGFSLCLFW